MQKNTNRGVKLPLIISLIVLGLLIPKMLYLNRGDHEHSTGIYKKATGDDAGRYELGGTIIGLQFGETLVVSNAQERINISMNGEFFFKKRLGRSDVYDIRVERQPRNQYCYIINGFSQSEVTRSDVLTVRVLCANKNSLASK